MAKQCALRPPTLSRSTWCERRAPALWGRGEVQFDRLAAGARARLDREFLQAGLEDERRDPLSAWRSFQNRIDSAYEQHCLGTPNSGRSYARRAHASRFCPRSWMSPSVGSILGEQGQQPADERRLYARQDRTGA